MFHLNSLAKCRIMYLSSNILVPIISRRNSSLLLRCLRLDLPKQASTVRNDSLPVTMSFDVRFEMRLTGLKRSSVSQFCPSPRLFGPHSFSDLCVRAPRCVHMFIRFFIRDLFGALISN